MPRRRQSTTSWDVFRSLSLAERVRYAEPLLESTCGGFWPDGYTGSEYVRAIVVTTEIKLAPGELIDLDAVRDALILELVNSEEALDNPEEWLRDQTERLIGNGSAHR